MTFVLLYQLEQHYRFTVVYLKKDLLKAGQNEELLI